MTMIAFALPLMLLLSVVGAQYSWSCNVETVAAGGPYSSGIQSMFSQLQDGVDSNGDNYKLELSIDGGGAIYGQASCNSREGNACNDCIGWISTTLQYHCPNAIGAQNTWNGYCFLRYESYSF